MASQKKTTKKAADTKAGAAKAKGAKQPAEPKPERGAKPKKLGQVGAALQVLAKAKTPMNCKEMVEAMTSQGLWSSPGGKTPDATLYSSILRELKTKGKESRFAKAAPGKFALAGKR